MLVAIVPVKLLAGAKTRLAPYLTPRQRRALVLAMLEDVLATLRQVPDIAQTLVVTRDADAAALARRLGALVVEDTAADINGALTLGARAALVQGARSVLALPADVPLATAGELRRLIHTAGDARGVALVAAHDGGTAAIVMRPPLVIPYQFEGQSAARHRLAAAAAGLPVALVRAPGLAQDIDRIEDLDLLAQPGVGLASADYLQSLEETTEFVCVGAYV